MNTGAIARKNVGVKETEREIRVPNCSSVKENLNPFGFCCSFRSILNKNRSRYFFVALFEANLKEKRDLLTISPVTSRRQMELFVAEEANFKANMTKAKREKTFDGDIDNLL